MGTKRIYAVVPLVMLLLLIGCEVPAKRSESGNPQKEGKTGSAELDTQLKIYKSTLLEGKSEQIRIDAATIMLFSEEPSARKILLEVLKQTENSAARVAVCKALSQTRASRKRVSNKEDFIQPLCEILTTENSAIAKLAAEATLIFEYEQISEPLEKMVTESSLPAKARLNAIYALKLQPDMGAIFKLMDALDDPEKQVAAGSEEALKSLGIPIGKDARTRKQIRDELKRKGRDEFLRYWLIRQETEIRELENELDWWKKQYLGALDKIYNGISGDEADTAKGKFLAEQLGSSKKIVRLWALEKVSRLRVGTSKLPGELGPSLINLISDQDRDVRLKTAKLLSLMGELNSAEKLLAQFRTEQDDEVRMEIFVALGATVSYHLAPTSPIKISAEVRKEALELAAEYLSKTGLREAQGGAEVIKKLLEQDGLTSTEVNRHLGLLAERYKQEKNKADGALRGELLSAMAGLCGQSVYKTESSKLFSPLFEEALQDKTNLVREAAVNGLVYIDKTKALKILRDFINDDSPVVRMRIIGLAGEVGGKDDLVWLAEKIGTTAEGEPAWQSMLKIFKRSDAAVLADWIGKFYSPNTEAKLSDEQKLSVLEIAEQKAIGENKLKMLKDVREKLGGLYSNIGDFERAAEYLGMLREAAQTAEEKERFLADLMGTYLRWPNVNAAARLVDNCLLEKDLGPNSAVVLSINSYLSKPPLGADPNTVLGTLLAKIKTPENRPKWLEQLKRWTDRLGQAKDSDEPEEADN